jgi:hypothetical protein
MHFILGSFEISRLVFWGMCFLCGIALSQIIDWMRGR